MTQITIRRLDSAVLQALKARAAIAGHSMEQEARVILETAVLPARDGMLDRLRRGLAERPPRAGGCFSDSAPLVRRGRGQPAGGAG